MTATGVDELASRCCLYVLEGAVRLRDTVGNWLSGRSFPGSHHTIKSELCLVAAQLPGGLSPDDPVTHLRMYSIAMGPLSRSGQFRVYYLLHNVRRVWARMAAGNALAWRLRKTYARGKI